MILRYAFAAAAVFAVSGAALALDAEQAIKSRQEFYKEMGKAFKGLTDDLKAGDPSAGDMQKYTAVINGKATRLPGLFPAGTGPEAGVKTGAKPEIWQKWDEFQKDAGTFDAAVHALDAAAQSGDVAAVRKAAQGLGEACKTCHETFRQIEH